MYGTLISKHSVKERLLTNASCGVRYNLTAMSIRRDCTSFVASGQESKQEVPPSFVSLSSNLRLLLEIFVPRVKRYTVITIHWWT